MSHYFWNRRRLAALVMPLSATIIISCGSQSDTDSQREVADARYATPESLLAQFNELDIDTNPQHCRTLSELFHHETEWQRRYAEGMRAAPTLLELDRVIAERFGDPEGRFSPEPRTSDDVLRLESATGPRAVARFANSSDHDITYQLVKVGDRWWFSGYTFEYRHSNWLIHEVVIVSRMMCAQAAAVPDVMKRVRAGEYNDAAAARSALRQAAYRIDPTLEKDILNAQRR